MFHPTDSYCIHVDIKASESVHAAVSGLVRCYSERFPYTQIFVSRFPKSILWGDAGTIAADLDCFRKVGKCQTGNAPKRGISQIRMLA